MYIKASGAGKVYLFGVKQFFRLTFFTIVFILMKLEAVMTCALIRADCVLTDVLTSTIIHRTLVFI